MTASIEKFRGCLIGLVLGDAIGAPFEGCGQGMKPDFQKDLPAVLHYTDDSEMAIGVAESLIASDGLDPDDMAMRFAENYNSQRGYGPGTAAIMKMIKSGIHWKEANTKVFKKGSFGNGAAMRVAPLGLFFSRNTGRLRAAVEEASSITHGHDLGKEGAVLLAYAVSLLVEHGDMHGRSHIIDALLGFTTSQEYSAKLRIVKELIKKKSDREQVVLRLGNSVLALESVPTALYAFLIYGNDFKKMMELCVSLGGDTDTISAMAGALSGCFLGEQFLPEAWIQKLENGEKGKDYIAEIAERLFVTHQSRL
jgi:poly(ADP-ribose) glycohydrolase ARH3